MEITISKKVFKKTLSVFMALFIAMSSVLAGFSVDSFAISDSIPINENDTKDIDIEDYEMSYLKFVPENTGVYSFSYYGFERLLYGYLYDENLEMITMGYDYYGIECRLQMGKVYYLGVMFD